MASAAGLAGRPGRAPGPRARDGQRRRQRGGRRCPAPPPPRAHGLRLFLSQLWGRGEPHLPAVPVPDQRGQQGGGGGGAGVVQTARGVAWRGMAWPAAAAGSGRPPPPAPPAQVVVMTHAYDNCTGVRYLTNGLKVTARRRAPRAGAITAHPQHALGRPTRPSPGPQPTPPHPSCHPLLTLRALPHPPPPHAHTPTGVLHPARALLRPVHAAHLRGHAAPAALHPAARGHHPGARPPGGRPSPGQAHPPLLVPRLLLAPHPPPGWLMLACRPRARPVGRSNTGCCGPLTQQLTACAAPRPPRRRSAPWGLRRCFRRGPWATRCAPWGRLWLERTASPARAE